MTSNVPVAVLFDLDGTLLDSNDAHALAWVDALREFNYEVVFEKVRQLIGQGGDKVLPELTGLPLRTDLGASIDTRRREIFRDRYQANVHPQPGARELVQRVIDNGQRPVIATSAQGEELTFLLERAGVADLIAMAASSADADRSKPDPDILEAALRRAGVPARSAMMVGDTPYDRDAARQAGVAFVGLRCGGWDDEALCGATAIYDDPAALLAHYEQSPLGGGVPPIAAAR